MEHALVVPMPELAGIVEPWLERTCPTKPSHGMPAHVTLLYPAPADPAGIDGVLAGFEAFDVEFHETARFPDVLYLAPDPAAPFVEITEALFERFPEWPPYAGAFAEVVPHLTVAQSTLLDEAEQDVRPRLPVRARAREAVLYRRLAAPTWGARACFPFHGG